MKKVVLTLAIIITTLVLVFVGFFIYTVYLYESGVTTQAFLDERDPKKRMMLLEDLLNEDEYSRWAWLDDAAELAYQIEDYDKAKKYSLESLSISGNYISDWNYGNSIHNANMILGRLSLRDGDVNKAKEYLLESAKSKGSPQLDTFGPSLALAKELLDIGEKTVVLSYLKSITLFWQMDKGCVKRWIKQIENDEIKKSCPC